MSPAQGCSASGCCGRLGPPLPLFPRTPRLPDSGPGRAGGGGQLPGRGAAVAALAGARVAAAAERGGAVGVPHAHRRRGAPGGGKKRQVLALAGGQLRTLGEHRQAAAAQRAPTSGSPPGGKQKGEAGTQTGVTEQIALIKMENQKEASPPGSPKQEWRLGRGAHLPLTRGLHFQVPQAQRRRSLHGLRQWWGGPGQAGGGACRGENQGRPSGPECETACHP